MERKIFYWLFALALAIYGFGFAVDIMDVDSAQYASISREMAETGNFLQVQHRAMDYLDKPPLLFWITSIFFQLFGYANWSFKIGSFLFTLIGIYSTFRLGKFLYTAAIGRLAAIILFTCQAYFLFNNDVRTDTALSGAIIFSIWQLVEWLKHQKWKWLVGASIGIALAMLAKGPLGLMIPALAVGSYLVGQGRWKDFFRWEYLVMLVLVALMLMPMLWGLYQQFDAQPEKQVSFFSEDGVRVEKNVSGVKFYLWTQSFGRLTGENVWKNNSGPFFFVHNFIWSFLPWALLFLIAFFTRLSNVIRSMFKGGKMPELLTLFGFLLPFVALSMSQYKLPHYIFPLYPLASILLAHWWYEEVYSKKKFLLPLILQAIIFVGTIGIIYLICFKFFPNAPWYILVPIGLFIISSLWHLIWYKSRAINLIIASVMISLAANFAMNTWFYPRLMEYQGGSQLAKSVHDFEINPNNVFAYRYSSFSFGYYMLKIVETRNDVMIQERLDKGLETYVVTVPEGLTDLRKDFKTNTIKEFLSYPVTLLSVDFLMPDSRSEVLQPLYLVELKHKDEEK